MTSSTKLDEKLEGAENFRAWRFRVMLVLREQDLVKHVTEDVPEPEDEEAKAKFMKDQIRAMRNHCRLHQGSFDPSGIIPRNS